jgi:hypothetical protein
MPRLALVATLSLALVGCGGDDGPTVDGDWSVPVSSVCAIGVSFKKNAGTYEWAYACGLKGGGIGAEYESGDADFSVAGQIHFRPRKVSCSLGETSPVTATYTMSDDKHLSLNFPGGAFLFERDTSGPDTAVIRFGCWSEDDQLFTDSPIKPI